MGRYRNHVKGSRRKAHGGVDRLLSLRILSAAAMAGMMLNPYAVEASQITDGSEKPYAQKGNVYDITAQKAYFPKDQASYGVNKFKDFTLENTDRANLYFHTAEAPDKEVGNLLNFVNNRIQINGTLNAIHNHHIGGNVYFLSPDGMTVGSGGVLNVGSLYVMTPMDSEYIGDKAYETNFANLTDNFYNGTAGDSMLANIQAGTLAIPLNTMGTITMLGKINASGDVKMYAPVISVGKNSSELNIFGTMPESVVDTAKIQTGVADFSSLVNLTDAQKAAAGLTSLQAEALGNGDIILAAKNEYTRDNSDDQMFQNLGTELGMHGSLPKTIVSKVENYGTIEGAGNVVLSATATNGDLDLALLRKEQAVKAHQKYEGDLVAAADSSAYAKTKAYADIQGSVKAGKDVTIKAHSDNTYLDNNSSFTDKAGTLLSFIVPMGADVAILEGESDVTIGKGASVEGQDVTVESIANMQATVNASASGSKFSKSIPAAIPSAAVAYAKVKNNAYVTIDGSVKASGAGTSETDKTLQVISQAKSSLKNEASETVKKGNRVEQTAEGGDKGTTGGTGTSSGSGDAGGSGSSSGSGDAGTSGSGDAGGSSGSASGDAGAGGDSGDAGSGTNAILAAVSNDAIPTDPVSNGSTDTGDGQTTEGSPVAAAAVVISDHENNSTVTINGTLSAANGGIGVSSTTENTIVSTAAAKASDETVISSAVNVMMHDSDAALTVNGTISGAGNTDISAKNILHSNTVSADNAQGKTTAQNERDAAIDLQSITDTAKKNSYRRHTHNGRQRLSQQR